MIFDEFELGGESNFMTTDYKPFTSEEVANLCLEKVDKETWGRIKWCLHVLAEMTAIRDFVNVAKVNDR